MKEAPMSDKKTMTRQIKLLALATGGLGVIGLIYTLFLIYRIILSGDPSFYVPLTIMSLVPIAFCAIWMIVAVRAWNPTSPRRIRDLCLTAVTTAVSSLNILGIIGFEAATNLPPDDASFNFLATMTITTILISALEINVIYIFGARWLLKRCFPDQPEHWKETPKEKRIFVIMSAMTMVCLLLIAVVTAK